MDLFLVGQLKEEYKGADTAWEFQGVFDSEDAAIEACKTARYFYYPVVLNEELSEESVDPYGAFYPKA